MDEGSDSNKIVRLSSRTRRCEPSREVVSARESTRAEIDALLGDLVAAPLEQPQLPPEPQASVVVVTEPRHEAPPPNHRNAIECPQCEKRTWRSTEHCLHCGFNLHQYFAALEEERQERIHARQLIHLAEIRRQRLFWAGGLAIGGITLMVNAMQMPTGLLSRWMLLGGFAMFVLGSVVHRGSP